MRERIAGADVAACRLDLFEDAIASVADAKAILERLYMDVGRARLGSARDQAVDQADDGRLARHVTQSLRLVRIHAERLWGRRPAGRELGGIDPVEARGENSCRGQRHRSLKAGREFDGPRYLFIQWVGQRDLDRLAVGRKRHRHGVAQISRPQRVRQHGSRRHRIFPDEGDAQQRRTEPRYVNIADKAEVDEDCHEPVASLLGEELSTAQSRLGHKALLQEFRAKCLIKISH